MTADHLEEAGRGEADELVASTEVLLDAHLAGDDVGATGLVLEREGVLASAQVLVGELQRADLRLDHGGVGDVGDEHGTSYCPR